MKKLLLMCALALGACSDDSATDGGSDATVETSTDLCDLDAFSGAGQACPRVSSRVCFPICEAGGGCTCSSSSSGPVWVCTNPPECHPCSNSPFADAEPCDAGDDAPAEAGDDASDASDAPAE